jgi:hypothetical protein
LITQVINEWLQGGGLLFLYEFTQVVVAIEELRQERTNVLGGETECRFRPL